MQRLVTTLLIALVALAHSSASMADDSPAVRFAKQDIARAKAFVESLTQRTDEAANDPRLKAVRAAKSAKAAVDALAKQSAATVAGREAELESAESTLAEATKAAAAARTALEAATQSAANLAMRATEIEAEHRDVAAAVVLAEADLRLATEATTEADGETKNDAALKSRTILLDAARTAATVVDRKLEVANSAIGNATAAREAAAAAVTNADAALATATAARDTAMKSLTEARAEQSRTQILVDQAAKLLQDVTEHAKPATESKSAAETAATEARRKVETLAARLARIESTPPAVDPKSLHEIAMFALPRPAVSCRFDGDAETILAGAQHTDLVRWNLVDDSQTALAGHRSWIRRFDADPELVVTGDYNGKLAWWNPRDTTPQPIRTVDAHAGYVRGVAISPDRRFVATGGNDGLVRVWDAATGEQLAELDAHLHESKVLELVGKPDEVFVNHVYNVAFDPTGRYLVSGDLVGVLKLWEVDTWKHVRDFDAGVLHGYDKQFRAHCGGIRGLDVSPDGKLLAAAGISDVTNAFAGVGSPCVVVFEIGTGKQVAVLKPANKFQGTCWSVRFHPSGEWLVGAGGGGSGSLWFWKPTEEKSFHDLKLPSVAYDVDLHPDGLRMAVALYDKTVRLYDLLPGPPTEKKPAAAKK